MRISYERGGLEESDMARFTSNPMDAWAAWFKQAVEGKVGGWGGCFGATNLCFLAFDCVPAFVCCVADPIGMMSLLSTCCMLFIWFAQAVGCVRSL